MTDIWKHIKIDPEKVKNNPYLNPEVKVDEPVPEPTSIEGQYILMDKADTYAKGVHALQEACSKVHPTYTLPDGSKIYRPLTFKENIEARVNDYESNGTLFGRWLDSCTGIAYKGKSSKFKIIPQSLNLITIDKDFNSSYLDINYNNLEGMELDQDKAKYNERLSKQEVLNHPAWLTALEDDKALLKAYTDIIFAEKNEDKLMGFWTENKPDNDQLRALYVYYLDISSSAFGSIDLSNIGSFLQVAQNNPTGVRKK